MNNNANATAIYIGCSNWERVPNESEKVSQSQAVFTVKEDVIHIKTTTFSLWSILACGGPRRKIATVFASRPDPRSDLIYLRFYVYSDNQDSKRVSDQMSDRNEGRVLKYALCLCLCIHRTVHLHTLIDLSMHKSLKMKGYVWSDEWVDGWNAEMAFFRSLHSSLVSTADSKK